MKNDRRTQLRFNDHSLAFVELEAAQPDSLEPAKLALARTVDISAAGMQIATRDRLNPGQILRVFVDNGDDYPLTLVGEVRWSVDVDEYYQAGLRIYESRDTAQQQWTRKVFSKQAAANA